MENYVSLTANHTDFVMKKILRVIVENGMEVVTIGTVRLFRKMKMKYSEI